MNFDKCHSCEKKAVVGYGKHPYCQEHFNAEMKALGGLIRGVTVICGD